jgi:hypothetical protein
MKTYMSRIKISFILGDGFLAVILKGVLKALGTDGCLKCAGSTCSVSALAIIPLKAGINRRRVSQTESAAKNFGTF